MATFFNSEFLHSLSADWRERKTQLRAAKLQDHNDYLYEVVSKDIFRRREQIHTSLTLAVQEARRPADLSIPLWGYVAAWYNEAPDTTSQAYEDTQSILRSRGLNWCVGLRAAGDVDYGTSSDQWGFNWTGPWLPECVHTIVQKTDFKHRISMLFGPNFWVSVTPSNSHVLCTPLPVTVTYYRMKLHYFPRGITWTKSLTALANAARKYATHTPATRMPWETAVVWSGTPPPATPPPATPPPATPRMEPPPLAQRTNGGGLMPDNLTEVAHSLEPEFDAEYEQRTPCYCGYDSE